MDEELENTANEALRLIIDNAASAKEFILSELPDVVQQILAWKAVESIAYCVFGAIILMVIPAILYPQWRLRKEILHSGCEIFTIFNLFLLIPLACGIKTMNLDWLQIWIAPKVYLIEYASELIK